MLIQGQFFCSLIFVFLNMITSDVLSRQQARGQRWACFDLICLTHMGHTKDLHSSAGLFYHRSLGDLRISGGSKSATADHETHSAAAAKPERLLRRPQLEAPGGHWRSIRLLLVCETNGAAPKVLMPCITKNVCSSLKKTSGGLTDLSMCSWYFYLVWFLFFLF